MSDDTITKLYYSIGEVSELTGLEPHVLRFWETEFPELQPRKNRGGRRAYTDEDIALVQRIQHLVRHDKYTLEGARQALENKTASPSEEEMQFRAELRRMRVFLENLLQKL